MLVLVAGGQVVDAIRLGLAMACLQFTIGVSNDVADAQRDHDRKPPKPIPAGLISRSGARLAAAVLGGVGLLLVVPSGVSALAVAGAGLTCGLVYDFALSRTPISWLPLALALPLVPLFAWLGATGSVSTVELVILPIGVLAGGGLAVSNALIDLDIDRERSRRTVAVVLGPRASWWIQALALTAATILVGVVVPPERSAVTVLIAVGALLVMAGAAAVRSRADVIRRSGWQIEAAGIAVLAVAWGLGTAPSG